MADIEESCKAGYSVLSIGDVRYFMPSQSMMSLRVEPTPRQQSPVTVINVEMPQSPSSSFHIINDTWIERVVSDYQNLDDVFNMSFLTGVIFYGGSEEEIHLSLEARRYLSKLGNEWTQCSDSILSSVALPSRLRTYSVPAVSPISGWRIVVKDNIHLKGIKSSIGNRAFYDTYGPQQKTADCIQRLIDQGIIVLGKTKMTSFGNWEEPVEYVDYQAPWNPRGDGYQSPGGSSSGSASAIAAYDWVGIAIGNDMNRAWDTPGFLGRDLEKCRLFAETWLRDEALIKDPKFFSAVIWPTDFWNIVDPDQCELARSFMQDIDENLGVEHWDISFKDTWSDQPPEETDGLSLADFINPATASLAYDVYHNSTDFREQYRKKFNREPFTTLRNRQSWESGKAISEEERDNGFRKIKIYARWFKETILKEDRANAVMILPLKNMSPRYRDEAPNFERPPQQGINTLALAPVLKAPALAVPIAEIPYKSRISQITEKLPFAACIVSPPGTDLTLLDCVRDVLIASGRPTVVKTGQDMFQ
ncbi:amidase signature enzyme [Penicillium herquei]|nr:amidase signature enzyme [Penicillium herquei]